MKLRIRGPSGQSVVTLEDGTTVDTLQKTIATETSLSQFEVKYGYPPKTLPLDQYHSGTKITELGVKLNGEQLIVTKKGSSVKTETVKTPSLAETSVNKAGPPGTGSRKPIFDASSSSSASKPNNGPAKPSTKKEEASRPFSFGNFGDAPPPAQPSASSTIPSSQKARSQNGPSAPLALQRKNNAEVLNEPPEIILPDMGGTLLLRIMPDDNSCLFRAVASALMPGIDSMNELRSVIAQAIQANPEKYSKVVLDNKDPDDYCRWIQTEDAWGGQIELDIMSNHFDIEICSIDVQRLRVDRYNEGKATRCILVYSGIHYDTIALSPFDMPPEYDVKVFGSAQDTVLAQAVALCQQLQQKHYFTDTAAFKIRCNICGALCVGETGATEHASQTGHYNFGEAA